jgi:hypothetical protein
MAASGTRSDEARGVCAVGGKGLPAFGKRGFQLGAKNVSRHKQLQTADAKRARKAARRGDPKASALLATCVLAGWAGRAPESAAQRNAVMSTLRRAYGVSNGALAAAFGVQPSAVSRCGNAGVERPPLTDAENAARLEAVGQLQAQLLARCGEHAVQVCHGETAERWLAVTGVLDKQGAVQHTQLGLPLWIARCGAVILFTDSKRCGRRPGAAELTALDARLGVVAVLEQLASGQIIASAVIEWRSDAAARHAGLYDVAALVAFDELVAAGFVEYTTLIKPVERPGHKNAVHMAGVSPDRPGGTHPAARRTCYFGPWWYDAWKEGCRPTDQAEFFRRYVTIIATPLFYLYCPPGNPTRV